MAMLAPKSKKNPVRVSFQTSQEVLDGLRQLAEAQGISTSDALWRSISLYKTLWNESTAGRKILIQDENKNLKEVILK